MPTSMRTLGDTLIVIYVRSVLGRFDYDEQELASDTSDELIPSIRFALTGPKSEFVS